MQITLTGSLGHIGAPLAKTLLADGHALTVVSSSPERRATIEALGAKAAIGRLQDADFLTDAFRGADAVLTLAPPANYFDHDLDLLAYFRRLGGSFAEAAQSSGVRRVVNLSSIGAHLEHGNGILRGTYYVEQSLDALPTAVSVTHLRPTEIYYNLYGQLPLLRTHGILSGNLAPDDANVWVAPADIAAAAAEELTRATAAGQRYVRYVASDEVTYAELAATIGAAIGKPDLPWVQVADEQLADSLAGVGMQPAIARQMAEMYAAIHTGLLYEDYRANPPAALGQVKVADFAQDFAAAYRQA